MVKVITVGNTEKGGVGKSTTAICIAQELIRRGYRVLTVDSEKQANTTDMYGANYEGVPTLYDIIRSDEDIRKCIQHTDTGDIIAGDPQLEYVEADIITDAALEGKDPQAADADYGHVYRAIQAVEDDYDYIVFDTPPGFRFVIQNILMATNYLVIVTTQEAWSVEGLAKWISKDLIEIREQAKQYGIDFHIAGILTTKAQKISNSQKQLDAMTKQFGDQINVNVFPTKIRVTTKLSEAISMYHVPIHIYDPKCNGTLDYMDFVEELLYEMGDITADDLTMYFMDGHYKDANNYDDFLEYAKVKDLFHLKEFYRNLIIKDCEQRIRDINGELKHLKPWGNGKARKTRLQNELAEVEEKRSEVEQDG